MKMSLTSYPNPFNSFTKIQFEVSAPGNALLEITDLSGKSIFRILKNGIASGSYEYQWDAASFPSGIYFCRLTTGKFTLTKKIILMK
ncbi:MAG: T9SS type A sorting domain-containing protein [Ignavibacteria bacterium]|nr:T9SS type A sorting domain-containing protein [Ignavibacteria bacterium]